MSTKIAETRMRTFFFTICKDINFFITFAMITNAINELKLIQT